jgi:FdrA protein
VAVILLDVVLGFGAHPNPASELAPAIAKARKIAEDGGRYLEVVAVVSGTDEDLQDMTAQIKMLEDAGTVVETSNDVAARYVGRLLRSIGKQDSSATGSPVTSVDLSTIKQPLVAINVGLESFTESLIAQGAEAIQVDWKPAAGGNEKLMGILERMRNKGA